jgi:hypothetical protein
MSSRKLPKPKSKSRLRRRRLSAAVLKDLGARSAQVKGGGIRKNGNSFWN